MKPPIELAPLFRKLVSLETIGAKSAALIEKLVKSAYLKDLLFHFPTGLIDRSYAPKISQLAPGKIATLTLLVKAYKKVGGYNAPLRVECADDTGTIDLLFFRISQARIENMLPIGQKRQVSGKVSYYNNKPQMVHPDRITMPPDEKINKNTNSQTHKTLNYGIEKLEPNYPLTAGLSLTLFRKAILEAIANIPELPEWYEEKFLKNKGFPSWKDAIKKVHTPQKESDLLPSAPARQRLAFDEILAHQLALAEIRKHIKKEKGRPLPPNGKLQKALLNSLPFSLTKGQKEAIRAIQKDLTEPTKMLRLLQGDVGCGKTIVSLFAILNAVEAGAQAALMAPTEILCEQHFESLNNLTSLLGITPLLLTGRDKGAQRKKKLQAIADGSAQIIIGTHALFQKDVSFHDLALAIIDEQHRFGVDQRFALTSKGEGCNILAMTATPIPRTLALTQYGDMEITQITEKPPGRKEIKTSLLSLDRLDELLPSIRRAIEKGTQIYWVCPLIEESEALDLAAAKDRAIFLSNLFPTQVALLHGKCEAKEKMHIMENFKKGITKILVATTVIEVGVNVPNANIMVIEHAERYGLSQLHQLRGRVGRGTKEAHTILLYATPLNPIARRRLQIMRESNDGFYIAEEDLKLRGTGDILGTKQSGMPRFKQVDFEAHQELIYEAFKLVRSNPDNPNLKLLLYLYGHEASLEGKLKN